MYFFTTACFAVTMHLRRYGGIDSEIHAKINDVGHYLITHLAQPPEVWYKS